MFTYASICTIPFSYNHIAGIDFLNLPSELYMGIIYVVLGGTFLPYLFIPIGQNLLRPTVACMYNYVQPIVASLIAVLWGMDTFGVMKGIAVALVFTGVYIVTQSKSRGPVRGPLKYLSINYRQGTGATIFINSFGYRMDKLGTPGMETDTTIFIRTLGTIFQVSFNRTPHLLPTGSVSDDAGRFSGLFPIRNNYPNAQSPYNEESLSLNPDVRYRKRNSCFVSRYGPASSPVRLLQPADSSSQWPNRFSSPLRPGTSRSGGASASGLGKQDYTTHRTVQTVGNTDIDISRLAILLFQPRLEHFRKRSITGFISLYNLTACFVYRDDMIVFVDNFHITYSYRRLPESPVRIHKKTNLMPGM